MRVKKAFTLIELIVVIAIIAILSAIITPNAFRAIEKAKISSCVNSIRSIQSAAYAFYADTGVLPCSKAGGWGEDPGFIEPVTPSNCWSNEGGCAAGCVNVYGWDGPYLDKWPQSSPWHLGGGGEYNWNLWPNYSRCGTAGIVTLEVYEAVPQRSLLRIDDVLDDGNLTGGDVFLVEGNRYLQFIVVCY